MIDLALNEGELENGGSSTSEEVKVASSCLTIGVPWPGFNDGLFYYDTVSSSDSGLTLIEFYCRKYKNSAPPQGWLQRIRNAQITIDGDVVKEPNEILRYGSRLAYHRLPWREPDAPYLIEVLYEDHDLVALNKPSGLQVLPGGLFQQRTVLTQLQWLARNQSSTLAGKESHPVPVHRLGRGTSGILLCAKTKVARGRLAAYFADGTSLVSGNSAKLELVDRRKISKVYRALVNGVINDDKILINQPIGLVRYPGVAKGLYVASPSGKQASSKVEVLKRDTQENRTLVQVEIESGRPHQIRIHLSFIGHPLLGDPLYVTGGQPNSNSYQTVSLDASTEEDGGYERPTNPVPGDCGYHLHAHQLTLVHPTSSQLLKLEAAVPPILQTRSEMLDSTL